MWNRIGSFIVVAAVCVCAVGVRADVFNMGGTRNADGTWAGLASLETATVGNPGNAGELSGEGAGGYGPDRVCGAVDYTYKIGKYEVTAGQYSEFLNAVATTDTYHLYSTYMSDVCGIERSGSSGSYAYSVVSEWANRPVNCVSYWDACRFANWLHNGQPTGTQGGGTTETGAYTLDGYTGQDGRTIQRNPGWNWAVTSEDEWYKAAYHQNDPGVPGGDYYDYTTGSDSVPSNDLIDPDPGNNATFYDNGYTISSPYYSTEVGAHENSDSPYDTFDQGGNVWEWNESVVYEGSGYSLRGLRGGSFDGGDDDDDLRASFRHYYTPTSEYYHIGFRVASEVPEPSTLGLLSLGGLMLLRRRRP